LSAYGDRFAQLAALGPKPTYGVRWPAVVGLWILGSRFDQAGVSRCCATPLFLLGQNKGSEKKDTRVVRRLRRFTAMLAPTGCGKNSGRYATLRHLRMKRPFGAALLVAPHGSQYRQRDVDSLALFVFAPWRWR